jgi:hypothetical protein
MGGEVNIFNFHLFAIKSTTKINNLIGYKNRPQRSNQFKAFSSVIALIALVIASSRTFEVQAAS